MTGTMNLRSKRGDNPFSESLKTFVKENAGRASLAEHEVKKLLKGVGLSVPNGIYVPKGEKPLKHKLRYPLVAKVSSSSISSKSDVGGVLLEISDKKGLEEAVGRLLAIKEAEGVLIEEMAPPGVEVIIGGIIDAQFGPVVMFGLGGIFVELFKDVAFGLAPLDEEGALRLAKQVKGYRLLQGYRGRQAIDMEGLLKTMVTVSELMAAGFIDEMDLNPVSLYPSGTMILDAKMSLKGSRLTAGF